MPNTVPTPTLGPNGFIIPDESTEILPARKADVSDALGGNVNTDDATPQGQLAVSESACIGNANDAFLFLSQMFDPAYSEGRYQDALGRIYFLERIGSQPTVVTATCLGAEGTVIPAGAYARAADGNLYVCVDGGTIPASGTIDLSFSCTVNGPIACPAGNLDTIYQAVPGWDSISNAADGVLGRDTETRTEFEERRFRSVSKNGVGSLAAILGNVLTVAGVLDGYATENFTGSPLVTGGQTLAPHSLYVCVAGGAQADVAKAIWTKKAPGCDMNGGTTVTVYDDVNYEPPYPSYQIKYQTAASLPVVFSVNIANSAQVPADAQAQIAAAILSAFSGADGGSRARIGSTMYASRYYGPVAALGAWAQIISIQIGSQLSPSATFVGSIAGTALTVTSVASGAIAIGQTVVGPGVADGTVITAGSGLSWTVNRTQTVASETMYGVLADQNSITAPIDMAPAASADNVEVTLT